MSEIYTESPQRLEFSTIRQRDVIEIVTGVDAEAWHYYLNVDKEGAWPYGQLTAVNPGGEELGPLGFALHGCGIWTTPRQNPVQKQQGVAFTPYYEGLITGHFMWGKADGEQERSAFTEKGQEISRIVHTLYRESTLLQVLANHAGPLSVRQLAEQLPTDVSALKPKDIRESLQKLIKAKRVSFIQKGVQLYELIPA